MAKVITHLNAYQSIMNFADQSIVKLETEMEALKAELEMWKNIKYSIRPCPHCHGEGKIRVPDASLGLLLEEEEACPRCAGNGKAG